MEKKILCLALIMVSLVLANCATTGSVHGDDFGTVQERLRKQWGSETTGLRSDGYLIICLFQPRLVDWSGRDELNMKLKAELVGLKCPSGKAFIRGFTPEYLIDNIGQPLCGRVKMTEVEVVCEDCGHELSFPSFDGGSGSGFEEMEKRIDLQFEKMEKKIDRDFEDAEKKLR